MKITSTLLTNLLLLILIYSTSALKILSVFPYQGKSHFIVFRVLLQELTRKGHDVTVISYFPEQNPPNNYHDIVLTGVKVTEDSLPIERNIWTLFDVADYLTTTGRENCEVLLANKQVQDLVKQKTKFDVIVVEQFNSDCAFGLAYKLNAPVVGVMSHILMPWHYNRYGIPYNPSYVPFHFLEGGTRPTLIQRLQRVVFDPYFKMLYYFVTQNSDQNTVAKYLGEVPPLEYLSKEIKFLLINHYFVLTGSRLLPANIIEVGGYHVNKAKPLNDNLKKFVDNADYGVIYISFGSTMKISTLPQDKLEAVLKTIAKLPQRFIWRWDDTSVEKPLFKKLPENLYAILTNEKKLYISKWLPQVDILGNAKVLAFLSHAGMGSTIEAIHFGVPLIAMPITGDQPANAAAIEESGLGVQIAVDDLTSDNLVAAFQTILEPGFHQRVKELSRAWHDRPLSALDTAVYYTEYAARNANFTFRSPSADVPLYQYMNLDIAFVFVAVFIILYMFVKVITWPCRLKREPKISEKGSAIKKKKKN